MSPLMLQTLYSPIFALLFILILIWRRRKTKGGSSLSLPPGPKKLPIIGNLHLLARHPQPHHLIGDLAKKHGPIMHLQLGQLAIVSSSKLAEEVLKTNKLAFAQRPSVMVIDIMSYGHGSIAFAPHGEYWKEMRKICIVRLLSSKRVDSFRSLMEEEVWNLVQEIYNNDVEVYLNFNEKSCSFANATLSGSAFEEKCKDAEEFIASVNVLAKLEGGLAICDVFPCLRVVGYVSGIIPKIKKLANKVGRILESIIDDHKKKRSNGHEEKKKLIQLTCL